MATGLIGSNWLATQDGTPAWQRGANNTSAGILGSNMNVAGGVNPVNTPALPSGPAGINGGTIYTDANPARQTNDQWSTQQSSGPAISVDQNGVSTTKTGFTRGADGNYSLAAGYKLDENSNAYLDPNYRAPVVPVAPVVPGGGGVVDNGIGSHPPVLPGVPAGGGSVDGRTGGTSQQYADPGHPAPVVPPVAPAASGIVAAQAAPISTIKVTPEMMVEDRINQIMRKDGVSMQLARSQAMQEMNARGLINSSMAVGASETARLRAAESIASKDASTVYGAASQNAGFENQASQFNASEANKFGMAQNAQTWNVQNMDKAAAIELNKMSAEQKDRLATLAVQQGYNLDTIGVNQINDLVKMDKSFGFDTQKMDQAAGIALNMLSAEDKLTIGRMAIAQGYDLDKMTANQINDLVKLDKTQTFTDKMADKAQVFDLARMNEAAGIALGQMSAEQQNIVSRLAIQQGYNETTMTLNQVNDLAKLGKQVEYQNAQADVKFGNDRTLLEIQKTSNLEIAGMEAKYRQQIQGSASATSIMNQLPTLIARVMDNKDTDAAAKQAQISYYVSTSTAALKLAGQFAGDIDLGGSLDGILGLTP